MIRKIRRIDQTNFFSDEPTFPHIRSIICSTILRQERDITRKSITRAKNIGDELTVEELRYTKFYEWPVEEHCTLILHWRVDNTWTENINDERKITERLIISDASTTTLRFSYYPTSVPTLSRTDDVLLREKRPKYLTEMEQLTADLWLLVQNN